MNYSILSVVFGCVVVSACGGSANETGGGAGSGGVASGTAGSGVTSGTAGSGVASGTAGSTASGGSTGQTDGGSGPAAGTTGQAGAPVVTGACKPVAACGGNIVGTWSVSQLCAADLVPTTDASCPNSTATISGVTESGTYTFNADNTTVDNVHATFTETANFPSSCFTEVQCTQLQSAFSAEPDLSSASCMYATATGCSCVLAVDTQSTAMGTYQVSGGTLTIVASAGATPETDTFCVSGNTLTIQNINANGGVSTITLTK